MHSKIQALYDDFMQSAWTKEGDTMCVCVREREMFSGVYYTTLILSQMFTCTFFNLLYQKQSCFFNITFPA
jgi:hypothetical protein